MYWWRCISEGGGQDILIDWQLIIGWRSDYSNTDVLDFSTIPYTTVTWTIPG